MGTNTQTNSKESKIKIKLNKNTKQTKQISPNEQKITELTTLLKQVQAEFENYKKRVERDQKEFIKLASRDVITKLLSVVDNFELALEQCNKDDKIAEGFELLFKQLISILKEEGLTKIETKGKFNPYYHEALMQEESDKEDDIILEEFQKGYMIGDRVLRPSKVKVNKQKVNNHNKL